MLEVLLYVQRFGSQTFVVKYGARFPGFPELTIPVSRYTCITMKTATIRDLRNDFARLSKWLEKGETIEIVKRGKPVAQLVPKTSGKPSVLAGCTPSPYPVPDDIDEPPPVTWELD